VAAGKRLKVAPVEPLVPPRRLGRRAPVLQALAVRRAHSLQVPVSQQADAKVVDVAVLLQRPPDFSQRRNSDAGRCLHSARESAAVPGDWDRRGCRSSSRHTGASRRTT
jgi:hypothetical protein